MTFISDRRKNTILDFIKLHRSSHILQTKILEFYSSSCFHAACTPPGHLRFSLWSPHLSIWESNFTLRAGGKDSIQDSIHTKVKVSHFEPRTAVHEAPYNLDVSSSALIATLLPPCSTTRRTWG